MDSDTLDARKPNTLEINGANDGIARHISPTHRCDNKPLRARPLLDSYSALTRPLNDRYVRYTPSSTQALDILAFWGAHCTSRTVDMKNTPRSRYSRAHSVRSVAHCSFWHRIASECSGQPRPLTLPACDTGIVSPPARSGVPTPTQFVVYLYGVFVKKVASGFVSAFRPA